MTRALDQDTIDALIMGVDAPMYVVPEQHGPLRRYERNMRCASRGCASPTYHKVQGVPYCMIHCMGRLNNMLIELGVES